jgi:hypothetical protein
MTDGFIPPLPPLGTVEVVTDSGERKTMSPTPTPGAPNPQRRQTDTATYGLEWTVLGLALLGWAGTFFADVATVSTWAEMQTPKFVGIHIAQLFTTITAIVAAKRIK